MNIAIFRRVSCLTQQSIVKNQNVRICSTQKKIDEAPKPPTNPLKEIYSATYQKGKGKIYDKKPFKYRCVPGKIYSWCTCGFSKSQPFCDGTHKIQGMRITLKPVKFQVTEEKDYWLCNCKQTSNRPFCDGTHLKDEIQETRC